MTKTLLIIRDGWGYRKEREHNAIAQADLPFVRKIEKENPTFLIKANGEAVGLPKGVMGNSEVGHMTIGAGRVIKQSLLRINESIKDGSFLINDKILKLIQKIKKNNSFLHLIILAQEAGVHSHMNHLFYALKYAKKEGLKDWQVKIHLILDGRDENPTDGIYHLARLKEFIDEIKIGEVMTISGRYFAMDRAENWERTEKYYQAIVNANGKKFSCGLGKLKDFYDRKITDEFIPPLVKKKYQGFQDNDGIFFLNFRKDRMRQIVKSLVEKDFDKFKTEKKNLEFLSMTRYYQELKIDIVFDDIIVKNTIGELYDKAGKKQIRIAESEKKAHVTFFFDGGRFYKSKNNLIDYKILSSPGVATFDLKPEMRSLDLSKETIEAIHKNYDFILLNFAGSDMVGHTGNLKASIKAVESIDKALSQIVPEAIRKDYKIIIGADHGNVEHVEKTFTSHTTNLVPFTFVNFNELNEKFSEIAQIGKYVIEFLI